MLYDPNATVLEKETMKLQDFSKLLKVKIEEIRYKPQEMELWHSYS